MATVNKKDFIKVLIEEFMKASSEESQKLISFQELNHEANNFLNSLNFVIYSENHQNLIEKLKEKKDKENVLYSDIQNLKDDFKYETIFNAQIKFEAALDKFLGRKIILTYVSSEGDINLYGEENIVNLLKINNETSKFSSVGKGRFNIVSETMHKIKQKLNEEELEIQQRLNNSIAKRKKVYATAIERYDKSIMRYSSQHDFFRTFYWWKTANTADGTSRIQNKGPITEGYVNAVVAEDEHINENVESSLEYLWDNYIKGKKDSIPATVKGDVKYDNQGNIQLAVKGGSFSTASIGQYIYLAENIKNIYGRGLTRVSPQMFQLALPKLLKTTGQAANQVLNILQNEEDKVIENLINNLLKNVKKDDLEKKKEIILSLALK